MAAIIDVTFEVGKPTELKVNGVKGKKCREISKPFLELLGTKTVSDKSTAEMQQVETAKVKNKVGR